MQITNEQYLSVRNEESNAIKDMSIEAIKARIMDYEQQIWKIKARQQSCLAVIQEDERKNSIMNSLKSDLSKLEIVPVESAAKAEAKEAQKTLGKIERQIESWKKLGIKDETIRQMARTLDPNYLFDDERKIKRAFITCLEHGRVELSKDQLKVQEQLELWICPTCGKKSSVEFKSSIDKR